MNNTIHIKTIAVVSQSLSNQKIDVMNTHLEGVFTSLLLQKKLADYNIKIIHICNKNVPEIPCDASIDFATIGTFHTMGLPIEQLLREGHSSLTMAQHYQAWTNPDSSFYHSSSSYGVSFDGLAFHHFFNYVNSMQNNAPHNIDDYCLASVATKSKRFSLPNNQQNSIFSSIEYDLHCDKTALINSLESILTSTPITSLSSVVTKSKVHNMPDNQQSINTLCLDDGTELKVDFVIDCAGMASQLNNILPEVEISQYAVDKTIEILFGTFLVSTHSNVSLVRPLSNGWLKVTQYNKKCYFEVHSNKKIDQKNVFEIISDWYDTADITVYSSHQKRCFVINESWSGNLLKIGSSALSIESTIDHQLKHIIVGCEQLLAAFPDKKSMHLIQDLYNRKTQNIHILFADYYALPFLLQAHVESEYWRQSIKVSDSLEYQLNLFKKTGVLPTLEGRVIEEKQWISLLIGLGYIPQTVDPLTKRFSLAEAQKKLQHLSAFIKNSALTLPTYETFKQSLVNKNATQHVGVKHAK